MAGISNTDGPLGPRIGVWGTFDVANYGDLLFPRVFEHEIGRRLPLAEVVPYSPFGYLHPVAMDGGRPADPLGLWEPSRRAQLASELDFVAVGGGEIVHFRDDVYGIYYGKTPEEMARHSPSGFFIEGLGADLETSCPVAWHSVGVPFAFSPEDAARVRKALASKAYVAVRDEVSRERLLATGTEREVHVVPDSALLLPNLYPPEVLARRLRHLKMMGWYPEDRAPLVLQGSAWIRQYAGEVGQAVASVLGEIGNPPVVLIEIGPCHGDGEFLDGLAAHLPGPLHRMPGAVALEDVAAALAHARAYAGLSLHGVITAVAFGVPAVILNLAGYSKLDGFARMAKQEDLLVTRADLLPDALRRAFAPQRADAVSAVRSRLAARVETHFDALAGLAERAWEARAKRGTRPGVTALAGELSALRARYGALLRAFEAQRSKLVEERLRYAEIVATLERKEPGRARDAGELA
ncbi:MAG TPA: polysaccharide pyruvyl transferase family protein, partial [Thermoanaerobaculia bacterium]|nr:polysaccharide pyruvyl transferase family protein [Thermoanaerobaculia bacterium]